MALNAEKVKVWIHAHIDMVHSVQDVADHFVCSCRTLERIFAADDGLTVSEYIKCVRFDSICKILGATDVPCCKIALLLGLGSYESTERAFKRRFGLTMSQFRRERAFGSE